MVLLLVTKQSSISTTLLINFLNCPPYYPCVFKLLLFLFLFFLWRGIYQTPHQQTRNSWSMCPMCISLCLSVCLSVRSFLPPHACRSQNIGTNGFTVIQKKTFITLVFAKNASFSSYCIICWPQIPPTTRKPQKTDTNKISGRLERH